MFEVNDFVRVRVPVSLQWFHAYVLEVNEDHFVVETMFPIHGETTWRISKHNIKACPKIRNEPPKPSKSLQDQLMRFKRKLNNSK